MDEFRPFSIQPMLVLTGGMLGKKSLTLPVETIEGIPMLKLCKKDRQLAAAVGQSKKVQPSSSKHAQYKFFSNCDVFQHMQTMRNDVVDQHIKTNKISSDPFAECDASAVTITQENRARLFAETHVPQLVSVTFPSFTTPEGKRVDETTIKMLSSPKKNVLPSMECSSVSMDWFHWACQYSWTQAPEASRKRKLCEEAQDMLDIPEHVKVADLDAKKVVLSVMYKTNGKWKRRQLRVDRTMYETEAELKDAIHKTANKLLEARNEADPQGDGDNESSGQSGEDE